MFRSRRVMYIPIFFAKEVHIESLLFRDVWAQQMTCSSVFSYTKETGITLSVLKIKYPQLPSSNFFSVKTFLRQAVKVEKPASSVQSALENLLGRVPRHFTRLKHSRDAQLEYSHRLRNPHLEINAQRKCITTSPDPSSDVVLKSC